MDPLYLMVVTTAPNRESATQIATRLVELRLAACANVLAPCSSIYHWQGRIENQDEVPLLVKTRSEHFAAVERVIKELHPYEVPEIIALPIEAGSADYLSWLSAVTEIAP